MGWETRRRGGLYYTRSRRVNGRVAREYAGSGPAAELAARLDKKEREARLAARAARRATRAAHAALIRQFDLLDALTGCLLRALLEEAGYHQHARGDWRKKRVR